MTELLSGTLFVGSGDLADKFNGVANSGNLSVSWPAFRRTPSVRFSSSSPGAMCAELAAPT